MKTFFDSVVNWGNSSTITNGSAIITGILIFLITGIVSYIFGGIKIKKSIAITEKHEKRKDIKEVISFHAFSKSISKETKIAYLEISNLSSINRSINIDTKILESEDNEKSINEDKDYSGLIEIGAHGTKTIKIGKFYVFLGSSGYEKCVIEIDGETIIEDIMEA